MFALYILELYGSGARSWCYRVNQFKIGLHCDFIKEFVPWIFRHWMSSRQSLSQSKKFFKNLWRRFLSFNKFSLCLTLP